MSDTTIPIGGEGLPEPNTYNPVFASSMALGTPVAISTTAADTVVPAKANSATTTYVIGVVIRNAAPGGRGGLRYLGPVTLESWADVLDTGSALTQGVPYYVSEATAGKLTLTPPDTGFAAPVGFALSPTTLFVNPSFPTAA
jgi:hypothetical protein